MNKISKMWSLRGLIIRENLKKNNFIWNNSINYEFSFFHFLKNYIMTWTLIIFEFNVIQTAVDQTWKKKRILKYLKT